MDAAASSFIALSIIIIIIFFVKREIKKNRHKAMRIETFIDPAQGRALKNAFNDADLLTIFNDS